MRNMAVTSHTYLVVWLAAVCRYALYLGALTVDATQHAVRHIVETIRFLEVERTTEHHVRRLTINKAAETTSFRHFMYFLFDHF